jgi:hypothetical protein
MKLISLLISIIAATALMTPASIRAQDEARPRLYLSLDCMKSTAIDYRGVELEIWQAIHQELVNRGKRNSWAIYEVLFGDRSKCDFYTVTTLLGEDQLNEDPEYEKVFKAAHPEDDFEEAMVRTWASRERVSTELWVAVDGTEIKEHRFAVVNRMKAFDADAYERMESQVFKPGHQALLDSGHRSGWGLYALVSPLGTSIPYNYSTVDFSMDLNPVPMAEAMISANPDRDLDAMQRLLNLRDQVNSETWVLVAATQSGSNQSSSDKSPN